MPILERFSPFFLGAFALMSVAITATATAQTTSGTAYNPYVPNGSTYGINGPSVNGLTYTPPVPNGLTYGINGPITNGYSYSDPTLIIYGDSTYEIYQSTGELVESGSIDAQGNLIPEAMYEYSAP
jgi:hypothetical protein